MTHQQTQTQAQAQRQADAVHQALTALRQDIAHNPPTPGGFFAGVEKAANKVENLWKLSCIGATGDVLGVLHTEEHKQAAAERFIADLPNLLTTAEEDARPQPGDAPDEAPPAPVGDGILYGLSIVRRALHLPTEPAGD